MLDEIGALTDVVRSGGEWIAAIDSSGEVRGYVGATLGEAAAWALLAAWDAESAELPSA